MKKLLFTLAACMVVGASYATPFDKWLYTAIESTGNGIVYMTANQAYNMNNIDSDPAAPKNTSNPGTYTELRYLFTGTMGSLEPGEEGADTICRLYFITKPSPGYGTLGFSEVKKNVDEYEDKDFVLDINGKRARSGSIVDVNDPNTPWMSSGHNPCDTTMCSDKPNRYFYAVFTKIPEYNITDGVDLQPTPESPTGTYTVNYSRHIDKGWNAIYLPFGFDADQFKSEIEGAKIFRISAYVKESGQLFYSNAERIIPACSPILIYSPVEFDMVHVGTDKAVYTDEIINTSIITLEQHLVGAFTNKTVGGKCYNLTYDGKDFAFAETENNISAFRFAIVFDDEAAAPVSKRITLNFTDDDTNGINTIEAAPRIANDGIYTLDGRRLNAEPTHGIFIKNGKKFVR